MTQVTPGALRRLRASLADHALTTAEKAEVLVLLDRSADTIDLLALALTAAESALADIGDSWRQPGEDLAWCEQRAERALPAVRAILPFPHDEVSP